MISVIMLTYNRRDVVGNMINDILAQTYRDFEYVIVDNGSDDGTSKLLTDYASRDSRIKVLNIEKSSIGRARNIGLNASQGEYVAYVDDDDRAEPDFLEFLKTLVDEYNADISMCGATEGDGNTKKTQCLFDEKYVLTGEEAVKLLLGRKYIRNGTATKLYRREILEAFPFVENYKNEDLHTQYKYLLMGKVVVIHGVDKYYITRHAGNVSGFTGDDSKWDAKTIQDYINAYHNRTLYLAEKAPNIFEDALYSEWSLLISLLNKIITYDIQGCDKIANNIRRKLIANKDSFENMPQIQPFERLWMEKYL